MPNMSKAGTPAKISKRRFSSHMKITFVKDMPGVHIDPQWAVHVLKLALYEAQICP